MLRGLVVTGLLVSLATCEYFYYENRHSQSNVLMQAGYYWTEGLIGKCTASVFLHTYHKVAEREKSFYTNPNVDREQPSTYDYTNSGMDRGHLSPAADNSHEYEANYDSFYVTNIAPQNSYTNRGPWADVENNVRSYARSKTTDLYIITCTFG